MSLDRSTDFLPVVAPDATRTIVQAMTEAQPLVPRLRDAATRAAHAPVELSAAARMEQAVFAALLGQTEASLKWLNALRDSGSGSVGDTELLSAFVFLRGGYAARAAGALERLEAGACLPPGSEAWILAQVLHAETLLLEGAAHPAADAAQVARAKAPEDGVLWVWATVALAAALDAAAEHEAALREVVDTVGRAGRCGLLAGWADLVEARVRLALGEAPAGIYGLLRRAIERLDRIGPCQELGHAYLLMAELAARPGAPTEEAPGAWATRAGRVLEQAGRPQDRALLREAFRRFGRRAIDRAADLNAIAAIETLRAQAARMFDLVAAQQDGRTAARGKQSPADLLVDEAIASAVAAGEAVIAALESAVVDREQVGRLAAASQQLVAIAEVPPLLEAIPTLAVDLFGASGAALFRRSGAVLEKVTAAGARVEAPEAIREPGATPEVSPERETPSAPVSSRAAPLALERSLAVALPGCTELVLHVVRLPEKPRFSTRDLERLDVFATLAGTCLARAEGEAALREAAHRDAATIEAIRDGVLSIDAQGVVRGVNSSAARLLGRPMEILRGRRLAEVPGLAALASAIAAGPPDEEAIVSLPGGGDLLLRRRSYAGGVVATLQAVATTQRLATKVSTHAPRFSFDDLVGESTAFRQVLEAAQRAARSDLPILITGESGTGKEMLAQAIHNASPRAHAPFVGINVAAIPRELLESELFGYARGAFTGARASGMAGKFELAGEGTLLLDEIGDMPLDMQAKLLRVLQERSVFRLGDHRPIPILARVVATTQVDLETSVQNGSFRLDLFHRLRVVHLHLPPLRARKEDIPALVRHHLNAYAKRHGLGPFEVAPEVMEALTRYEWPGNVRELANVMEGEASLLPPGERRIRRVPAVLRGNVRQTGTPVSTENGEGPTIAPFAEVERRVYEQALRHFRGNVSEVAAALKVAKGTVYNKIKRYGIDIDALR
ncbi:MAG: PAS domain-containing protein [Deltaproteobacteria bacterium]|nr:MAG: PAS domain-containing protein [Deltaproteobacteria bacterium]